jgi:hypothetical protein
VKAAVARSNKGGAFALDIADAFLESDLMQSLSAGQWVNGSATAYGNATTRAAAAAAADADVDIDVDIDQNDGVHSDNGSAAAANQFDDTAEAAAAAGDSDAENAAADNGSVHDNSSAVDDTQSWADDTAAAATTADATAAAGRSRSPSPSRAATQRASHSGAAAAGAGATGSTAAAARSTHHGDDGYAYTVPSDFGGSSIASESDYRGSHSRQHQQQQRQQQRQHRHASTTQQQQSQQQQQQQQRKDYSGWVGDYTIGKRAAAINDAAAGTTTAGTVRGRDEAWTIPNATANSSNLKGVVQSGSISRGFGVWDLPQRSAATAAAAGGSSSSGARYRVRD